VQPAEEREKRGGGAAQLVREIGWQSEGARLCVSRGGSTWGARGIKPPYLPNTHGYPPKPLLDFWDETMKRKRGGRRREKQEEEESGHNPPLHFWARFATGLSCYSFYAMVASFLRQTPFCF